MNRKRRQEKREEMLKEEALKAKVPVVLPPSPITLPPPKKTITNFSFATSFLPNHKRGGAHQFILTLIKYLQENKCLFINNPQQKHNLLLVVADLAQSLETIRQSKAKIVHRVDGCFYDHGYPPASRDITQREISKLADLVIYQSQYGKNTLEDKGIIDRDVPNVVIYNGVNRSVYKPVNHSLTRVITIVSANNSTLKIKRVDRLNTIVGYDTKVIHLGKQHPSVVLHKSVQVFPLALPEKLNNFFGSSHAFIHTGDMDTCPNVVIQALSTGLPIIYWRSSGGVPELAGNAGLAVEDYPSMKDLLQDLRDNYMTYHNNALERARLFDMRVIGQQYLDVMRGVLNE